MGKRCIYRVSLRRISDVSTIHPSPPPSTSFSTSPPPSLPNCTASSCISTVQSTKPKSQQPPNYKCNNPNHKTKHTVPPSNGSVIPTPTPTPPLLIFPHASRESCCKLSLIASTSTTIYWHTYIHKKRSSIHNNIRCFKYDYDRRILQGRRKEEES